MSNYESSIPKAKKNMKTSMAGGTKKAAEFVLKDIQNRLIRQNAKDTGALIDSYVAKPTKDGFDIGSTVDYAAYVEFGTGKYAEDGKGTQHPWAFQNSKGEWRMTEGMRPRPHVRPAFEENAETIERLISEEMQDIE